MEARGDFLQEGTTGSVERKRWILASFGLVVLIVVCTCWPVFANPQLDPDDYRYLQLVQSLDRDFFGSFLDASIVENHWDHLWWSDMEGRVRFFRPIVISSYWLDSKLYGDNTALGMLITNVAICDLRGPHR